MRHKVKFLLPALVFVWAALAGGLPAGGETVRPSSRLLYSTYIGRVASAATAIAVDRQGNVYLAGSFTGLPTRHRTVYGKTFAGDRYKFVDIAKLRPGSDRVTYSVELPGEVRAVAVDGRGDLFAAGATTSTSFPVLHPLQARNRSPYCGRDYAHRAFACDDGFIAEFGPDGVLLRSTYLGGSGTDCITGIAVGSGGQVYAAGTSDSPDFPTVHAFQPRSHRRHNGVSRQFSPQYACGEYGTIFVARLDWPRSRLIYSRYLGGSYDDAASGIAIDRAGNA